MKILLINNFHYWKGGSETVYFNTARLLREHGHDVVFFSQKDNCNEHCPEEEFFFDNKGGMLSSVVNYFYNRNAAIKLEKLLQTFSPDIAHVHLMWGCSASAVLQVLRRHGVPIVHTSHDYRMVCPAYVFKTPDGNVCERCNKCNYFPCLIHKCSKNSVLQSFVMMAEMYVRRLFYDPIRMIDGFIFVSHFSEFKHCQHDSRFETVNKIVLYNCTETKQIEKVKGGYYLYFGRLSKEKGLITLLEAFRQHPGLTLRIIGSGPMEDRLKDNLPDNVQMCGYMNGESLFSAIAASKYVIVPSECYENNPMAIVESYSLGVPVIGADIGGIPEIVDDGITGFLFDPFDIDGLVQAIKRAEVLSEEEIKVLSRNAVDYYQNHFSEDIHYENLMNFYNKIINC